MKKFIFSGLEGDGTISVHAIELCTRHFGDVIDDGVDFVSGVNDGDRSMSICLDHSVVQRAIHIFVNMICDLLWHVMTVHRTEQKLNSEIRAEGGIPRTFQINFALIHCEFNCSYPRLNASNSKFSRLKAARHV